MTTQQRVDAAARWLESVGERAPVWEDVEIVARLAMRETSLAQQILFEDRDAVLRHWSALQDAMAGSSGPVAAEDDTPSDPGTSLSGAVGDRYRAMRGWLQEARRTGEDVSGVSESDLVEVAQAAPSDVKGFKVFRESLRIHAEELLGVLREAGGSADAGPAPVDRPTPSATVDSPAPAPVAAPAETTTRVWSDAASDGRSTAPTGVTDTLDFSHFQYRVTADVPAVPLPVEFTATGSESLQLSWPVTVDDLPVVIYAVVTSTEYAPVASPQLGLQIVSTFDTQAVDNRPFTSPVRYVAIWRSSGRTVAEARSAQPELHAAGACVLPVRACTVREDEGTVIGNWQAIDGVLRVNVLRLPVEQADVIPYYDESYRVPADSVTTGGFTDRGALPGKEYEYRIYALARLADGDEPFSPFVAKRVRMSAVIEPIVDLRVESVDETETRFDLSWTPPKIGDVEIYRSERPLPSNLGAGMLERATLVREGVTEDLKLVYGAEVREGRMTMPDVPMPTGWTRAYFTPVTVLENQLCRVGEARNITKPAPVTQVRIVERVDEQFLTFAWPEGSPIVKIYRGAKGSTLIDPAADMPIHELSEEDYRKYGGAHLTQTLPPEGCSVHVVGTSFARGRARYAKVVTVQYDGLVRVRYRVQYPDSARGLRGRSAPAGITILGTSPTSPSNLPLVLVHHPSRLPLHPQDGTTLATQVVSFVADQETVLFGPSPTAPPAGYLRVFAQVPRQYADKVALLDPPVEQLRTG